MKPAVFEYVRPKDIAGAIKLLAGSNGSAKLIAGGQSLGPMLNLRLARPELLVDIGRLPELRGISDLGSSWRIGSATTHAEIEDGSTPLGHDGLLPYVARSIAYRAIRNRGTVGGSLAHADPAADWPLALAACDAVALVEGPASRRINISDLMVSTFTTLLSDTDIIAAVEVPKPGRSARWGYFKLCRKVGEFPIASAAVVMDGERSRIFIGALPGRPRSLPGLAAQLASSGVGTITGDVLKKAVAEVVDDIDAIDLHIRSACLARAIGQVFAS